MTVINFSTYIKKNPSFIKLFTDANSHRSINLKTKLF